MSIYSISDFINYVRDNIKTVLPAKYDADEIEVRAYDKNNNIKYYGLCVKSKVKTCMPILYLESFYHKLRKDIDNCCCEEEEEEAIRNILLDVAEAYAKADTAPIDASVEGIKNFENIKDKIIMKLINRDWNRTKLIDTPHTDICDLSITYHVALNNKLDIDGIMSTPITENLLMLWNKTIEEIHEIAINNINESPNIEFLPICNILAKLMGNEDNFDLFTEEFTDSQKSMGMYVLTTTNKVCGAIAALSNKTMKMIYNMFEGQFYMLPSSIHEWIIWDARDHNSHEDTNALINMVNEVNETQVPHDDRLSDTVYTWNPECGLIKLGYNDIIKA